MWQRKTKSAMFMSEFNDDLDWEEHDDFVHMNTIRMYAKAWDLACRKSVCGSEDLMQFEMMIKQSIERFWGPCDVKFIRSETRILVKAKDGRTMELVTGEQEVPPPILSHREMVLH